MPIAVAFTGPSNSGKTTLIEKIAKHLLQNYKIGIIKNDPKDKATFDTPGKDSDKFSRTGAEVIVASPTRTTFFSQRSKTLEEMVSMFGDIDILLVEGLKSLPLPRILVARDSIDVNYLDFCEAIAVDETINKEAIPSHLTSLDLNNPKQIAEWILQHGKEI